MTCPECGAEDQRGRFCAECGTELNATCAACGERLEPGARHCGHCGEAVADERPRSRAPLWIAAAAALVVVLILFIPERAERAGPLPAARPDADAGAPMGGTGGGFTGDMRADADRLFNRIMTAAEQGRQEEVDQFMPMAVQAYGMVPDLDADGLFHLAILHQTAGEHGMAIATAERILEDVPDHVLGLGVAGSSAVAAGDAAAAREYFRRLMDGYEVESARLRPEYVEHQPMVEEYRRMAESFLAS